MHIFPNVIIDEIKQLVYEHVHMHDYTKIFKHTNITRNYIFGKNNIITTLSNHHHQQQ